MGRHTLGQGVGHPIGIGEVHDLFVRKNATVPCTYNGLPLGTMIDRSNLKIRGLDARLGPVDGEIRTLKLIGHFEIRGAIP